MLTAEGFLDFVLILISAIVLIWLFSKPWSSLWIDVSRQTCFELRDRLFLLALDGQIGFDDPIYRRTREWLNACISHAHDMKFWNVVVFIATCKPGLAARKGIYAEILKMEDGPVKTQLLDIADKATTAQLRLMVVRSPFLLAIMALPSLFLLVGFAKGRLRNAYERMTFWPERMIYSYDSLDRPAAA